MTRSEITNLDLNLLKVLDAIYQCGTTVKAAEQLGVSQSRVSQLLAQLREELNDPLFIRAQGRLQPTARATALSHCLARVLPEIYAHCYDPGSFNPEQYSGRINIFISAILIDVFGPKVLAKLTNLLPQATIILKQWSPATIEAFDSKEINLGINHYPLSIGKNIRQIPIAQEQGVITMRQDHPKARQNLSLDELFESRLAGAIIPDLTEHQSVVESLLKDRNIDFAVRSDNLSALYEATLESDLILIGLAIPYSQRPPGLCCFIPSCLSAIPMATMSVAIYYRQSLAQDPRIVYLEGQLKRILKERCKAAIDSLDRLS